MAPAEKVKVSVASRVKGSTTLFAAHQIRVSSRFCLDLTPSFCKSAEGHPAVERDFTPLLATLDCCCVPLFYCRAQQMTD